MKLHTSCYTLERELELLEITLYSSAKIFLPIANSGYDNYISWFEPPDEMQMVILLLPCEHAWQVPAYLHWHGSFNFNSETTCALLKLWDKKYGLELICHYGTMLQIKVDKFPSKWKDAFDLAALQNIIAPDTLGPLGISIRDHAKDLMGNYEWFLHNRP